MTSSTLTTVVTLLYCAGELACLEDVARGDDARDVPGQRAAVLAPLDGAAVALLREALEARLPTDVDDLLGGHHVCNGGEAIMTHES